MKVDDKLKPLLNTFDLIKQLKEKNIKFLKMKEDKALLYLKNNNNYYNITSYKNNFEKYFINGEFVDKYIDLDFAYLKDLSIIDKRTRIIMFEMTVDIEHFLKLHILKLIENISIEDGYRIVNMYLDKDYNEERKLHNNIFKRLGSEQYKSIVSTYND